MQQTHHKLTMFHFGPCQKGKSITMEAYSHVEAPEEALAKHGRPEIFTTDQGSRFTSADFTSVLIRRADQECNRDQP